jgi:rare lipoprotein A
MQMVKRREQDNPSSKTSLRIWLLAGASSIVLTAGVIALSMRTVHADAPLPRPSLTAPPALSAANATPVQLAPHQPVAKATSDALHGIASWYGGKFNGRHTASGERFDMYAMTACHPTLPFGTVVRVVNLNAGRIIDLSYGAAEKLEMVKNGLVPVDLEVLTLGGSPKNK